MFSHSTPSTSAGAKSGLLLLSIMAFPRIRVMEILLKSWPVGSLSSQPFLRARACPSCLTCPQATLWKPPKVSTARGKNWSPWVLQASAVSLVFLSKALARALPASLAAPWTLDGDSGLVTVTSIAASLPLCHLLIRMSPGRAVTFVFVSP